MRRSSFLMTFSGGLQDLLDGGHHALEIGALGGELLAAGRRERIEARAAIVFRCAPLGGHPAVEQEALKRGIEGAFADFEDFIGAVADGRQSSKRLTRPIRFGGS